jgi:tetratricopeptide (TPR) repeat protein
VLLGQKRNADAKTQLQLITREAPNFRKPGSCSPICNCRMASWMLPTSLTQFSALLPKLPEGVGRAAGESQLYLLRADLAEKRQRYDEADIYLQRIPDAANLLSVQARRADLLARQGKVKEARALIQAIPANGPNQKRLKQIAEVQLLRDAGLNKEAYALQAIC